MSKIAIVGGGLSGVAYAFFKKSLSPASQIYIFDPKSDFSVYPSTGLLTYPNLKKLQRWFDLNPFVLAKYSGWGLLKKQNRRLVPHRVVRFRQPFMVYWDVGGFISKLYQRLKIKRVVSFVDEIKYSKSGWELKTGASWHKGFDRLVLAAGSGVRRFRNVKKCFKADPFSRSFFAIEEVYRVSSFNLDKDVVWFYPHGAYGAWIVPLDGKLKIGAAVDANNKDDAAELLKLIKISFSLKLENRISVVSNFLPGSGVALLQRRGVACRNLDIVGDAGGFCGPLALDGLYYAVLSSFWASRDQKVPAWFVTKSRIEQYLSLLVAKYNFARSVVFKFSPLLLRLWFLIKQRF